MKFSLRSEGLMGSLNALCNINAVFNFKNGDYNKKKIVYKFDTK